MTWPIATVVLGVLVAGLAAVWLAQRAHFAELREQYRQAHLELEAGVVKAFDDKVTALDSLTASLKSRVDNLMANQRRP